MGGYFKLQEKRILKIQEKTVFQEYWDRMASAIRDTHGDCEAVLDELVHEGQLKLAEIRQSQNQSQSQNT